MSFTCSKAWVNKLMLAKTSIFIDDSEDHFESVKNIGLEYLSVKILPKGSKVEDLLKLLD